MGYQSMVLIGVTSLSSAESSLEPVSNSVQYSFICGGIGHLLVLLRRCAGRVRVAPVGSSPSFSTESSRYRVGEAV